MTDVFISYASDDAATMRELRQALERELLQVWTYEERSLAGSNFSDGYNAQLSLADAAAYRMVVATSIDGRPLALGGLGPQWAVYDADNLAAFKDKPLKERFTACPWGLYHIDVKKA